MQAHKTMKGAQQTAANNDFDNKKRTSNRCAMTILAVLRTAFIVAIGLYALIALDAWYAQSAGIVGGVASLADVELSQRTGTVTVRARAWATSYLHAARIDAVSCNVSITRPQVTRSHVATLTLLSGGALSLPPRAFVSHLVGATARLTQIDADALKTALWPFILAINNNNNNNNNSSSNTENT